MCNNTVCITVYSTLQYILLYNNVIVNSSCFMSGHHQVPIDSDHSETESASEEQEPEHEYRDSSNADDL